MRLLSKKVFLFLTIMIEGYVVLAIELLAIRQLIPFIGNSVETTSIIIGGVLIALAIGYHVGGTARSRISKTPASAAIQKPLAWSRTSQGASLRRRLVKNVTFSILFVFLGLSSVLLGIYFSVMTQIGLDHRLVKTFLYTLIFIVPPLFWLGQTIPLVSNYFSSRLLSETTGKMLCFSTLGAFLGSIFSTIVLMSFFGVHNTVIFTVFLLFVLCLMVSKRATVSFVAFAFVILVATVFLNSDALMQARHVVADNAYSTVQVMETPEARFMVINGSPSSKIAKDPKQDFSYITYINDTFINRADVSEATPRSILVIGAGGFTVGRGDTRNLYTFVDIDSSLKDVAERTFLKEPLTPNKRFVASSARAFLNADSHTYDLIVIDVYTMNMSIPMECVTQEFLEHVKTHLAPRGWIVANVITDPAMGDLFAVRYNNTFAQVFPHYTRHIIGDFNPWFLNLTGERNILYMYANNPHADDREIYRDNRNTYSLDRP